LAFTPLWTPRAFQLEGPPISHLHALTFPVTRAGDREVSKPLGRQPVTPKNAEPLHHSSQDRSSYAPVKAHRAHDPERLRLV